MAIATLSRFTVPLATDQSASNQGMLFPKMSNRFRITLENFGVSKPTTELTKQVQDAARPKTSTDNQVIHVYNSQINIAGKYKWDSFSISLRDDVTGAVSKLVGEQMQKQFDFYEQSAAASAGDYKFTTRIEILDGGNGANAPVVYETWECYGCYITTTDYSALKYSEATPLLITMVIQPDNCIQTGAGAGLGTTGFKHTHGTLAVGG